MALRSLRRTPRYAVLLAGLCAGLSLGCRALPAAGQTGLGRTDPNGGPFPDSSLADFRWLLDAPAGKYGFLRVGGNGHFVWPNGKRARFWGVNISNKSVFVGKEEIDRVVDVLARAGCNMVRFEAIDSRDGILDIAGSSSSRALDAHKLSILDYWVAKLRERGIYYYLDLLDFREFKADDEVPAFDKIGRAAKPTAFFDPRLIELQKEFARQLLQHTNPITGLRYVDDPALAMVELCNEHGLFMRANALDDIPEPYQTELRQQWNRWLMLRYGSRDALKAAWGARLDAPLLSDTENPRDYTVKLPLFTPPPPPPAAGPDNPRPELDVIDVRRGPARLRDGVRFLYDTQRAYFREMKAYLREIGLNVPVTGVVSNDIVPDVASVAAELDFTSENYYADHPAFAGKDWQGEFFYNDTNPLRTGSTYQLAPWLAALRWENKPVVVREWANVWPNRYRAISVPEMAAYASQQDFDAVLLFGYQICRKPAELSDFDHQADPTVWGLFALGGASFLRADVAPAPTQVTVQYTPDTLFRWPNTLSSVHRAAWFARLNSHFREEGAPPVTGGRGRVVAPAGSGSGLSGVLARVPGVPANAGDSPVLPAQSGPIVRRTNQGLLTVTTSRTIAVCGELPTNRPFTVGGWTFVTPTPIGAVMIVSLDGKPLSTSSSYIVKMVSRAENTAQSLERSPKGAPARYRLKTWGHAPVVTFGRPDAHAVRVLRGKTPVLSLALSNGTWELLVRGGQATLVCDTPGIRGTVLGRSVVTTSSQPLTVGSR